MALRRLSVNANLACATCSAVTDNVDKAMPSNCSVKENSALSPWFCTLDKMLAT